MRNVEDGAFRQRVFYILKAYIALIQNGFIRYASTAMRQLYFLPFLFFNVTKEYI